MCLLRIDGQENSCTHEGCKNYYLMSKQICMFSKQTQFDQKPLFPTGDQESLLDRLHKKIKKESDPAMMNQDRDLKSPYLMAAQANHSFTPHPLNLAQMSFPTSLQQEVSWPNQNLLLLLSQQSMAKQQQPSISSSVNASNDTLTQLLKLKSYSNVNPLSNTQKIAETLKIEDVSDEKKNDNEFQSKLFDLIHSQNKILFELKEKHNVLQDAVGSLRNEVSELKRILQNTPSEISTANNSTHPSLPNQFAGNNGDSINTDSLLSYLYGPNIEFPYQLVLKHDLSLPLYRERNFRFTVLLVDKNGNRVQNTNRVPISLGIYSSEGPPKFIDTNTAGNKILKGLIDIDLVQGSAFFEKVQIKEVTSHFRNGWIFFVVYPKANTSGSVTTFNGNANFINSQHIKPLILEKVVVKAKRVKEKDVNNSTEIGDEMGHVKEEDISSHN